MRKTQRKIPLFPSLLLALFLFSSLLSCGGGNSNNSGDLSEGVIGPMVTGDPWAFRGAGVIGENRYLIGGPLAQGRTGDVLLQNDKIRLVIQKPRRNAGVALYGGNIIDADITRGQGEAGRDTFGITFPLINVSWTPYYKRLEILNANFANGPVILRATGILNVYDYIQTSIIVPFSKLASSLHPTLLFPAQYNDVLDPFTNVPKLRNVSTTIVTDYILRADKSYLIVQTHLRNSGNDKISMPIGDWVNGSGTLETFAPRTGFTGQGRYADVPALIYPGMETNVGVSYGMFFDPSPFLKSSDGTLPPTDLLTVSGVSIMAYGEKIAPAGLIPAQGIDTGRDPKINFSLPPGETVYTRYFAVGNGDVGSVMQGGLEALGVSSFPISGRVTDVSGAPVENARVLVMNAPRSGKPTPVSMLYSKPDGSFSGIVSTGSDNKAKLFGSGRYQIEIYKEGYKASATWPAAASPTDVPPYGSISGKSKAGSCDTSQGLNNIQCLLGQSGLVQVSARDENGANAPARIAIVGFDPSPYGSLPQGDNPNAVVDDASLLSDMEFQAQQYGYVDTLFLGPDGKINNRGHARFVRDNIFRLEPGDYSIFVMRGPEYSLHAQRITVTPGGTATVNATLRKVVDTRGYVSADFHIHGINSPDSPFGQEARVNFAMAEGLDLMISADHDAVTDYNRTIQQMGVGAYVAGIPGMEVTPMAFGHFNVFPVLFDPSSPTGGAFDYTKKGGFNPGPNHREMLSPGEFLTMIDEQTPGEQVLQVNHIMDNLLGNFALSRLVTTTKLGVPPLSTFSDPTEFRLPANSNQGGGYRAPYPYGTNKLFTDKFTAMELCIGESAVVPLPHVLNTAIPTWFDLLNLGKAVTVTCSSDTHRQIREPIGILRNYIALSTDPRDGVGSFNQIDQEEMAHNVNGHHVIVSAGPFMRVQASANGQTANVGDLLSAPGARSVNLEIHVESPDWMDWDTVEVFVNTDPTPAADDLSGPWRGSAEEFVGIRVDENPLLSHVEPRYIYDPTVRYKRGGGDRAEAMTPTVSGGKREVTLNRTIPLTEDSWIVVLVKGSDNSRTLFPYAPKAVNTVGSDVSPDHFLDTLDAERNSPATGPGPNKIGGGRAFAFSNAIFVDVDGGGWQAKYVRSGQSPLR